MLNCGSTHRHKYSDPVTEVNQRVTYLADQGGERIILGCHDRGNALGFCLPRQSATSSRDDRP